MRWSHSRSTRVERGERGSSLIIALVFMTVLSVIIAALFYMAFTNLRSMRSYRIERNVRYNADAALEMAIDRLRADPELAEDGACRNGAHWTMPMNEGATADPVIFPTSELYITCASVEPATQIDGEQGSRLVWIKVNCRRDLRATDQVACGTGPASIIASALVRFDPDPSGDYLPDEWAVIPKVLQWNVADDG